mmetsp:Transcript_16299/g.38770  ORF Transcript_16299/g.38770 Transcript_16299/m.38770 type:complete len:247 (+) Transcript_16299:1415-2155(+)
MPAGAHCHPSAVSRRARPSPLLSQADGGALGAGDADADRCGRGGAGPRRPEHAAGAGPRQARGGADGHGLLLPRPLPRRRAALLHDAVPRRPTLHQQLRRLPPRRGDLLGRPARTRASDAREGYRGQGTAARAAAGVHRLDALRHASARRRRHRARASRLPLPQPRQRAQGIDVPARPEAPHALRRAASAGCTCADWQMCRRVRKRVRVRARSRGTVGACRAETSVQHVSKRLARVWPRRVQPKKR